MIKIHSEATDASGITHYLRGALRFVKRTGRKRVKGKGGHYETQEGCHWWCTNAPIREGTRAHPGKPVNCMACIADPPRPPVLSYAGTATGRMSYAGDNRTTMMSTPSGERLVSVFEAGVHRTIKMGARGGRRR